LGWWRFGLSKRYSQRFKMNVVKHIKMKIKKQRRNGKERERGREQVKEKYKT